MPTPEDLDRLRALLTQLTQIGSAHRGELIRADDWNTLVNSVADVARAVLAADAAPVIPPHQHLDQVTADWLAPQLRSLIERGPLADPAVQNRLSQLEQTLARFGQQLDSNEKKVDDFRGRITDVATRDLAREAAVTSVRRSLENVIDPRPDIQAMRTTLGAVQKDITTVQEIASKLTVGGVPVDVGQLVTRVGGLEQFRDTFRAANGELLNAAAIERRLAEVSTRTVTQNQLDDALKNFQVEIPQSQIDVIQTRLEASTREQVNGVMANFRGEVDTNINTRLAGVADLVSQRVNDALPGLTQSVTSSLNQRIDAAQKAAVDTAVAAAQKTLDDREKAIRADVASQISDTRASIAANIRTEVSQQLASGLTTINTNLAGAVSRLDTMTAQVNKQAEQLTSQAAAIAKVTQDTATLSNNLRTMVQSEISLQVAVITRSIDDKFAAFQKAQNDTLAAMSNDIRTAAIDAARKTALDTANASAQATRTQILAEMRSVAREEATALIRDQVKIAVTEAVKEQTASLPGLIATEVRRATSTTTVTTRPGVGTIVTGGH
jgi:hypothetical protein